MYSYIHNIQYPSSSSDLFLKLGWGQVSVYYDTTELRLLITLRPVSFLLNLDYGGLRLSSDLHNPSTRHYRGFEDKLLLSLCRTPIIYLMFIWQHAITASYDLRGLDSQLC